MTRPPRRFNVRSPGGPPALVCLTRDSVMQLVRAQRTCTLPQLCVVLGPHRDSRVAYAVSARPQ